MGITDVLHAIIRRWNGLALSQARWRVLPGRLAPYLPAGAQVLDVGCGSGRLAQRLAETTDIAGITGVDTVIQPDAALPVIPYDGHNLPFDTDAFDLVLLIDVLHHSTRPEALLAEALRVSRGRVLVKDHYWANQPDRWLLAVSDYLGNAPYGIDLPYNYLSPPQWARMFAALGLTVARSERFTYGRLDRCKQVIFALHAPAIRSGPAGTPPPRP